jgi:prophage antirepressor-like protein/predicted GIY-YIG superfamily endonuclease
MILNVNKNNIFIIFDETGDIWFGFRDLLNALGYNDPKNASHDLDIDKKYIKKYKNIKGVGLFPTPFNLQSHTRMINNNGLFMLLSISKKKLAKQFMKKYIDEIMPQITKTGKYISSKKDMELIMDLRSEINKLKNNNKVLMNNMTNIVYPIGSAIYIIKQTYNNKTYYKVGYTKNLNKRLHTYNTGLVNKIHYNYYIMIEDPTIDKCMKEIMKNKQYIKNKEYYKSSLSSIINFIKECHNTFNSINCGFCHKKIKLDHMKIKQHNCKLK